MNLSEVDEVMYKITNEYLDSIMKGLNPNTGERFLSICSSGDVPFALSEFGEVIAFDISPLQVEFAKMRKEFLQNGDFRNFSNPYGILRDIELVREENRAEYFTTKRLENLMNVTDRIKFLHADFKDINCQNKFDGIYLSNSILYLGNTLPAREIIKKSANMLNSNGRVYITNGQEIDFSRDLIETGLVINQDFITAKDYYSYDLVNSPIVLIKESEVKK